VDTVSIRERLVALQKEIEQICREDRIYKKKGRFRAPEDFVAHDNRMTRMRQILEEIAKLSRQPTG
jgi:hypothetical protein